MTPSILVVGSLHYDIIVEADHLPRRDETAVGRRWYPKFGGKGGNQAVAAARAEARVRMVGAVGADEFGRVLLDGLNRAGVDAAQVATLSQVGSGMSVAIVDAKGDYAATIVSGANLLVDPAVLSNPEVWETVSVLVLQNEVPEAVNRAAAMAARARGVLVLLNAAPARALDPALSALVDVLVVNAVEAEMLGAGPVRNLDGATAAAVTLRRDYSAVVVTAGAQGLAAVDGPGAPIRITAEPVNVVSTHGAGDCFVGVLAAELARGARLEDACRTATIAAGRHVAGAAD